MNTQATNGNTGPVLVAAGAGPIKVTVELAVTVDAYQWGADTGAELEYVDDVRDDVREYVADLVTAYLREQHPHARADLV